ncbi:hypothetical protein JW998_06560 [candidate division KSB1 bacterium]|nr:hypothetical protein [candidate division KSB1 bacterium]
MLLLGGSDEDNLFNHPDIPPNGLAAHLDLLVSLGGNYVRNTMSSRDEGNLWPHDRDPETGLYDLDRFGDAYWQRFGDFLEMTRQRSIIVQIEVFDRFDYARDPWDRNPFNPKNNINYTGAILPKRDAVDSRIIEEARGGFATYEGLSYKKEHEVADASKICGIIDTQNDVGCWPKLESASAPKDSDHDGYPIRFAPFYSTRVQDAFWQPILERNRTVTIPHVLRLCEETGMLRDLDRAAGLLDGAKEALIISDETVYKAIESAALELARRPDSALAALSALFFYERRRSVICICKMASGASAGTTRAGENGMRTPSARSSPAVTPASSEIKF